LRKGERVVIAHGHAHVREGLRQILLEEGEASALAEAADATGLMSILQNDLWDLIVMETALGGPALQDQITRYRVVNPSIRVVMLSPYPHAGVTELLMESGADAVVMEERIAEDLVATVRSICRRVPVFSRGIQEDSQRLATPFGGNAVSVRSVFPGPSDTTPADAHPQPFHGKLPPR
jgi:DNA-binding NarL/FixJ family response regulator